jgi:hypothetical protein
MTASSKPSSLLPAQRRLTAAGADRDAIARERVLGETHAEWHPEPQPFEWIVWRRQRVRGGCDWCRRPGHGFPLSTIGSAGGNPTVVPRPGPKAGRPVAISGLLYQVCDECHLDLVAKIEIASDWQGWGLGTRMVRRAHAYHRDYAWHTTPQQLTSGTFWQRMSRLTGATFTEAAPCVHMSRDLGNG